MKKWKSIISLVIIVLLLEISKTVLPKTGFAGFYFFSTIASCLQFFFLLYVVLIYLVKKIIGDKLKAKRKSAIAIITVMLFFSITELLFAFWLNNPQYIPQPLQRSYWYYYDYYDCRVIQFQKQNSIYDSTLFYRLHPASRFLYKNREFSDTFSINRAGLRDRDSFLIAPAIICLGDSYAMGWGVQQSQTFASQLAGISGLRVLNAGISSYGTVREMDLLKQLDTSALRYVIIQYCSNDVIENTAAKENGYQLRISSEKDFDSIKVEHEWVRKYFPGKYFFTIAPLFIKQQINKLYPLFRLRLDRLDPIVKEEQHAALFLDILNNLGLNMGNTKIIVTMMDSYPHAKNNFLKEVEKLSQKEPYRTNLHDKLLIVDVMAGLDKNDFYLLDLHIKASGHKKIAELLWQAIKKN